MAGKDALPEKTLLQKTDAIKTFEYSLLDKELKSKIAEKYFKKLDKVFKTNEKVEGKTNQQKKSCQVKSSLQKIF